MNVRMHERACLRVREGFRGGEGVRASESECMSMRMDALRVKWHI